jgi:putative Holliday junction resolvase
MQEPGAIMALDVGERRIGVAVADPIAKIAHPLTTIENNEMVFSTIKDLIINQRIKTVVLGLPRDQEGQETQQTQSVREFAKRLEEELGIEVNFQDESVTSITAEEALKGLNKPYSKEDIDRYAAAYILEDYLQVAQKEHA